MEKNDNIRTELLQKALTKKNSTILLQSSSNTLLEEDRMIIKGDGIESRGTTVCLI